MDKPDVHVGKMESQLSQWGAKLDELVAKAGEARAEAKVDYRRHLDELKEKHQVARSKLDALKAAGSDEWDALKAGVETAWKDCEAAFKKVTH